MIVTEVDIQIQRDLADVFGYVADMRNLAQWGEGIGKSELISGEAGSAGAVYRCHMGGLPVAAFTGDYAIIECTRPGERGGLIARCATTFLEFEDSYVFTERDGGTHVSITDRLRLIGPAERIGITQLPVIDWFHERIEDGVEAAVAPAVRAQIEKDVANLKQLLESS